MNPLAKKVLINLRDILILCVIGFSTSYFFTTNSPLLIGFFASSMWIVLWKGNELISHVLSLRINWLKQPFRTFVIGFVSTIIYSAGVVYLLVIIFETIFNIHFGDISSMLYSTVIVTVIITFFMNGRAFLMNWRKTTLDAEALKRENLTARYENLKNQVNPHFLFNSLNALTNLVYTDQDKAAKFIKQLSEVYRFVLDTHDKEVVSLEEELQFLNSYIYLQQIRCGDKLKVSLRLKGDNGKVPPLALQMLVENAIKHNAMSEEEPLHIEIYQEDGHLVIENNIQEKTNPAGDNSGLGLDNIKKRYDFLTQKKVVVNNLNGKFIVKLPIILERE